jgi:hypothetical protein
VEAAAVEEAQKTCSLVYGQHLGVWELGMLVDHEQSWQGAGACGPAAG